MAAKPKPEETALAVLSDDEFTAALRREGWLAPESAGTDINRVKVSGSNLVFGDDILAVYNQKTKEPACYVRIAGEPRQKQQLWFSKRTDDKPDSNAGLAQAIEREDVEGRFCTSHYDIPSQNKKYSESGASCDDCPVNPWIPIADLPPEAKGQKCKWKADLDFWILEKQDDGTYTQTDETLYTLTLSTTGIIEFIGSSSRNRDNLAGSVSPMHTNARIAKLGMQKWGVEGISKAKTMLALGGVIAALHILPQKNQDGSRTWSVPSFDPVDIIEIEEQPQLTTNEAPADDEVVDDIPF